MRNMGYSGISLIMLALLAAAPHSASSQMPAVPNTLPPAADQAKRAINDNNQADKELFVSEEVLNTLEGKEKKAAESKKEKTPDKLSSLEAMIANLKVPETSKKFNPSFGGYKESVFFDDSITKLMIKTLDRTERIMDAGGIIAGPSVDERTPNTPEGGVPVVTEAEVIPELIFRAYHVSSIMYQSPKVWAVWINGERITPKRNKRRARVVAVGPDYVRLNWKPDLWEYRKQVWDDEQPLSKALQKIKAKNAISGVDVQTKSIYATLRQNQTWVTVYPLVVEGNHQDLRVRVTPQAKEESDAEKLQGLAEQYSAKKAKEYVDEVLEKKAKRKAEPSATTAQPATGVAGQPSATPGAAPNIGMPAIPAPPIPGSANPPASTTTQQPATPSTLNDILNAVGNTPPPSAPANINAPVVTGVTAPAPLTPPLTPR